MCMLHSTWTSMKVFSILCICYIVHTDSSSLLPRRDGGLEQTARLVLETTFPRCTPPQREERKSACAYAGYAAPMLRAPLWCRREVTVYSFLYVLEFGVCLPALQAWRVWRSSGLPVVLTEHRQMTRQDKPLAEANTNTFTVILHLFTYSHIPPP